MANGPHPRHIHLTEAQVAHMKWLLNTGHSASKLAFIYECSISTVQKIRGGKVWAHVKAAPVTGEVMKTYTIPDRRPAASGPWDDEPDKAVWIDPATGLDCMILRHDTNGNLCGYVGVPPEHPWHGRDWRDFTTPQVHGGINYSNPCDGNEEDGICHTPEPGRTDNVWWFGFDCGHGLDLKPKLNELMDEILPENLARPYGLREVYRDFNYVKGQVTRLAVQVAAVQEDQS